MEKIKIFLLLLSASLILLFGGSWVAGRYLGLIKVMPDGAENPYGLSVNVDGWWGTLLGIWVGPLGGICAILLFIGLLFYFLHWVYSDNEAGCLWPFIVVVLLFLCGWSLIPIKLI